MSVPKITYDVFSEDPFIEKLTLDEGTKGAYDILKWAYDTYGESIVYACSFVRKAWCSFILLVRLNLMPKSYFRHRFTFSRNIRFNRRCKTTFSSITHRNEETRPHT